MNRFLRLAMIILMMAWAIPGFPAASKMGPVNVKAKAISTTVLQVSDASGDALISVPEDGGILLGETPASTPSEGTIWYDTSAHTLKYRDNSTSNTIATGAAASLDAAYNSGATITQDATGDLLINAATSGNNMEIANTYAGTQAILLELDSQTNSQDVTDAILFSTNGTTATITDAIDASDAAIVNAINVGANEIVGTTGTINLTDFDVDADGAVVLASDESATMITLSPSASTATGIDASSANLTTAIKTGAAAIDGTNFDVSGAGAISGTSLAISGAATIGTFKSNALVASSAGSTITLDGDAAGGVNICSTSTGGITLGDDVTVADAKDVTIGEGKLTVDNDANETAVDIQSSATTTGSPLLITSSATALSVISATADDMTTGGKMLYLDSDAIATDNYYAYLYNGTSAEFTISRYGATVIAGVASTDVLTLTAGDLQITAGDIDLDNGQVDLASGTDQVVLAVSRNVTTTSNAVMTISQTHASATGTALDITQAGTGNDYGVVLTHNGDYSAVYIDAGAASDGDAIEIPMANRLDERALNVTGAITGTAGEGVIEVHATGNIASTAALLRLDADTGTPAGTQGYCIYVDDDAGVQAGAYAVEINSEDNEGLNVSKGQSIFAETVNLTTGATLQNGETLVNSSDGVVRLLGEDDTGLDLLVQSKDHNITGDASLTLSADASGDNGDEWRIISQASGNDLSINTDASGSFVEVLNLTTAGVLQIDSDLTVSGGDISSGTAVGMKFTTNSLTTRYAYMPISYVSATEARIGGIGLGNLCVGLAGVDEIGSTEGYVTLGEAADFLRFTAQLPPNFVDGGSAADLVLEFDLLEQDAAEGNYDVRIFEYGNTTPIITDTIVVANGASRAWSGLVTLSTGIGADADIDADDLLLIEITATSDDDNVNVYGARLTYKVGVQATRT